MASAAAILVADRTPRGGEAIKDILVGSLLWVTWPNIIRLAVIYGVVGVFHWVLRQPFPDDLFPSGDRAGAGVANSVVGLPVLLVLRDRDHLLGAHRRRPARLLVSGRPRGDCLSVHPAAGCPGRHLLVCRRAGLGGRVVVSFHYDLPTGPVVVCMFGLLLLAAYLVRRALKVERAGLGAGTPAGE